MFKVGDTVRVTDNVYGHEFLVGDLVVIQEIERDGKDCDYKCWSDEHEDYWHLGTEEFELVDPLEVACTDHEFWQALLERSKREDEQLNIVKTSIDLLWDNKDSFAWVKTAEGPEFWNYVFKRIKYFMELSHD